MRDDLISADYWAGMVDVRGTKDEELRKRFSEFSMDARKMLLEDWKDLDDERMQEIVKILKECL